MAYRPSPNMIPPTISQNKLENDTDFTWVVFLCALSLGVAISAFGTSTLSKIIFSMCSVIYRLVIPDLNPALGTVIAHLSGDPLC